jgi:hypothetical protein
LFPTEFSFSHTDYSVFSTPLPGHFVPYADHLAFSPQRPFQSKVLPSQPQTPEQFHRAMDALRQQHTEPPGRAKTNLFDIQELPDHAQGPSGDAEFAVPVQKE